MLNRKISIAPMMDYTDRHCRYFLRLLSKHVLLYTEMITTGAIIHGNQERFLSFNTREHPVALQLGGSDPAQLAYCARIASTYHYDEINLNVGCPSNTVTEGEFGACLMKRPKRVAECISMMRQEVDLPITIKTRIGVDEFDSYDYLKNFIDEIAQTGCTVFIVHARKAWLKGLSPKENREIPPLCYEVVYQLKQDFPALHFTLNGGVKSVAEVKHHLQFVDGVMIGRQAYQNPYLLAELDAHIFNESSIPNREAVAHAFLPYVEEQLTLGVPLAAMTRHLLGLFQGLPGARAWRRHLSQHAYKQNAGPEVIEQALTLRSDAEITKGRMEMRPEESNAE